MMLPVHNQDPIRFFIELLKGYQIYDSDHVARELLRVHRTKENLLSQKRPLTMESVYQEMRKIKELDTFQGDQELFWDFFQAGQELDFYETLLAIYQEDRTGIVVTPEQVTELFFERISQLQSERILIPEAHKFLRSLPDLLAIHMHAQFVLLAEDYLHKEWLSFLFRNDPHVEVIHVSLYSALDLTLFEESDSGGLPFDYIFALPAFGRKSEIESDRFLTRESEGVAVENLLELLHPEGELSIILPARFTFSGGGYAKLRKQIVRHYGLSGIYTLPGGTLRPYTMMKTYLMQIQKEYVGEVELSEFRMTNNGLQPFDPVTISLEILAEREDWKVELIRAELEASQQGTRRTSELPTRRLKEMAELFRGKSIMKSHIQPLGEIEVLNISNIEEGEIIWDQLDRISEDFVKVKRYALERHDLVLTCRGTVNKVAVVTHEPKKVIASANIIVVRFTEHPELWSHYLKIFLETPLGLQTLQSFQRGTTVMNINPADLREMEIPILPQQEIEQLVQEYTEEQQIYRSTIQRAQKRWQEKRKQLYQKLT